MSSLQLTAAQSSGLVPVEFQRRIIHNMAEALLRQPSPPCLLRAPTGSGFGAGAARPAEIVKLPSGSRATMSGRRMPLKVVFLTIV